MRSLVAGVLGVLVACSGPAQAPHAPASKLGAIDAWVIDAKGPVANAELRLVSVTPEVCACKADRDAGDNALPECACPESLARWRKRAEACTWPVAATTVLRSDGRGQVALGDEALGHAIEATAATGAKWLTLPPRADRIAIELGEASLRHLRVDSTAELRATLLFDDGHCVPFRREGPRAWVSVAPVPRDPNEWPVLLVEAGGLAPIARTWFESDDSIELELHAARAVAGTCDGDSVVLDNPFQHIVAKVDRKQFSIAGAFDATSDVKCMKQGNVVDEWTFTPADGLVDGGVISGGLFGGSCQDVVVVDRAGRPIADAEVSFEVRGSLGSMTMGGSIVTTGAQGRACVDDVYGAGELVVHPPLARGGWCAGEARLRVTQQMLGAPIKVTLQSRTLTRSRWRGRLLSAEKIPVAGASIRIDGLEPAETTGCSTRVDQFVTTGVDGSFTLPLLPKGQVTLDIQHDWYAEQQVEITVPSREREIVLDRGVTWTGRVLDPDGNVIDHCSIFLTLPNQRLLTGTCSPTGFSFGTLVPGDSKVSVRVEKHALGTWRAYEQTIHIDAGKPLRADIRWPAGESIAGRVVDSNGTAIAGARITALPKGTTDLPGRFAPGEVMLEADRDGRFTLRHLQPGVWTLTVDRRARKQVTLDIKTGSTNVEIVTTR